MTMNFIRWIALLSACCVLATACTQTNAPQSGSEEIEVPVKRFLDFYFHDYGGGLPKASQRPLLAAFLTEEFLNRFDAALKGQACYAKKVDNEGPPLIQGDLFSSLFEGATTGTTRVVERQQDRATVEIAWTYDGGPASSAPFAWKDRVTLVRSADGWLISDFTHLGDWAFMTKGNVSEILLAVAKECDS